MADIEVPVFPRAHSHVFLGEGHEHAERRTWAVIWLCAGLVNPDHDDKLSSPRNMSTGAIMGTMASTGTKRMVLRIVTPT
jgi:hypothetical protein